MKFFIFSVLSITISWQVLADQPPSEDFSQPCLIIGLFGDGKEVHSACLWQTQLRRRADVLECHKEVVISAKSLGTALHTTIRHPDWVYWIIVGDGDWLVSKLYEDAPNRPYFSCLYRRARQRGNIDWPHDAFRKNAQGEFEHWTITRDGKPIKVPQE